MLDGVRTGLTEERVRLVLDFKGKASSYFSYFVFEKSPYFIIDLPECSAEPQIIKTFEQKSDRLIKSVTLKKKNFRRIQVIIELKYELPEKNVKMLSLKESSGDRLVFDFYRNYSVYSSYLMSENMRYSLTERGSKFGYTRFTEVTVDLSGKVHPVIDVICASSPREKTTAMRARTGATMAVNGGFFAWSGGNLGLVSKCDVVITPHVSKRPPRTAFALYKNNKVLIERMVAKGNDVALLSGPVLKDLVFAIGGGPRLVKSSAVAVNADEEALGPKGNDITRLAARTSVGIDKAGNLHFFTANGYFENHSEGVKLEDMAQYMVSKGIRDGMNFDGGGSTVMDLLGTEVSRSFLNVSAERPVGNSICVFEKGKVFMPYTIAAVTADKTEFYADGKDAVSFDICLIDAQGNNVPDGTSVKVITSCGRAPFFIETKDGRLNFAIGALKAVLPVSVYIECGPLKQEIWKGRSLPGTPKHFYSQLVPLTVGGVVQMYRLEIVAEDEFANPVPEVQISLDLTSDGIPVFRGETSTDLSGMASVNVDKNFAGGNLKIYYNDEIVGDCALDADMK